MDIWTYVWTDGRTDGWMDGRTSDVPLVDKLYLLPFGRAN